MLDELKKGLAHFKTITYKKHEKLYSDLENTQNPHTLFIACSDSRVSPEILIDSDPGEVFTIRNIANTVPAYETSLNDITTVSSIEYAIDVLGVEEVIICGHSNCGGCAAVLNGWGHLTDLPYTQNYLKPLETVKEKIEKENAFKDEKTKARLMEQMNVVEQVNHLKTFPGIQEKLATGQLEIEGWYFDIKSGNVSVYDESSNAFIKSEEYKSIR
ncbi:carbonic anhydrase [Alkalibacterium olivapovliticus]|uniref:Carbonic anhydrase n=1 Tax=Alkalibacterium olivapovliticus TaxID=99907 RepID=A0A2T0VWA0_9LACT|nr:carbonic anhydrase [Alkalibacterium olivapovliticus]PRY76197.1 carbonic anhydrase [Alkalibacterium olivapovliticus]